MAGSHKASRGGPHILVTDTCHQNHEPGVTPLQGTQSPTKADKRGPQNKARLRGGTFDPVMPLSRGTTLAQEAMGMLVLVARASKHGATEGITERVAQALTLTGQVGQLARKGRDLCHFAGHLCARDDANGRS